MSRSRRAIRLTLGAWSIGTASYACAWIRAGLDVGEAMTYEREWDWQLMFFAVTRLPWLLAGLGVVLLAERRLLR